MAGTIKINWNFAASINGGPQVGAFEPAIEVSAYDYIKVTLPAPASGSTASSTDVHLQPASTAGAVSMVAILSEKYSDKVSYTVDSVATARVLDGPHVFLGPGAVSFLNSTGPQKLTFANSLPAAVTVQVLVGRAV
jgi:hypothetical protein